MSVVTKEQAIKEIESWLDYKKVGTTKRDAAKENIEAIANHICDGVLSLNTDMTFVHHLKFTIGEEVKIEKLEYKPRINAAALQLRMKGVESGDVTGRLNATVCALAGKDKNIIGALDSEDLSVAHGIAVFFL